MVDWILLAEIRELQEEQLLCVGEMLRKTMNWVLDTLYLSSRRSKWMY
jgi:hypothetical protein